MAVGEAENQDVTVAEDWCCFGQWAVGKDGASCVFSA